MKYLKSINEYNNIEFIDNLEDITLELKDIGFEVDLKFDTNNIAMKIWQKNNYSNFTNDVTDFIIRLNSYMKSEGWQTQYRLKQTHGTPTEKFYVKGDSLRTQDIHCCTQTNLGIEISKYEFNDKWPSFVYLTLTFRKINVNESKNIKNSDLIIYDIKDILLELNDEGYYTDVYRNRSPYTSFHIQLDISKSEAKIGSEDLDVYYDEFDEDIEPIKILDIKEVLERILDYCKENNIKNVYYDINDTSMTRVYPEFSILTDVFKIDDSNLKKLSLFLEFKI